MSDYLDLTDAAFDAFFTRLNQYLAQKCAAPSPEWTHIPAAERDKLTACYTAWNTAYLPTLDPHTKVETLAKNDAKNAAKAAVRPFVNRYLREDCPEVQDTDRAFLGIPNKDTIPTHHPAPTLKPEADAVPAGKGKHRVTALNPETDAKKKPPLVKGVAFAHHIRSADETQPRAEDMPSDFQMGTTREYQWPQEDYGKIADYACAYENAGGKRGPWSDVVSLIIG
jgi:hypothetical protein